MSDVRQIRLRYRGTCCGCGAAVAAGTQAFYDASRKAITCVTCAGADPAAAGPQPTAPPVAAPIDYGTAGAAARREHERRAAKDEARLRDTWGPLGGLAVALSGERHSTKNWETGAVGEERLGSRLDRLREEGIAVFHDRRIPGSRANIDHIVITSGGVHVIDAKRHKGRPALHVSGGLFRPRTEKLLVRGRDRSGMVDRVLRQVDAVTSCVGDVSVTGTLCFVEADWPLFGGDFTTRGVWATWPRRLAKELKEEHASTTYPINVEQIASLIATRFEPA